MIQNGTSKKVVENKPHKRASQRLTRKLEILKIIITSSQLSKRIDKQILNDSEQVPKDATTRDSTPSYSPSTKIFVTPHTHSHQL